MHNASLIELIALLVYQVCCCAAALSSGNGCCVGCSSPRAHLLASRRPSRQRCRRLRASQARRSVTSMGRSPSTSCASHPSAARRAARNSSPLRTPICSGRNSSPRRACVKRASHRRRNVVELSPAMTVVRKQRCAMMFVTDEGRSGPDLSLFHVRSGSTDQHMFYMLRRRHTCSERRPDMRPSTRRRTSACVPPSCSVLAKLWSRPPPLHCGRTLVAWACHEQSSRNLVGGNRHRSCCVVT